jgi:hypothetical protein
VELVETPGVPKARATVTYRAPVRVPGIARLLNPNGGGSFELPLTATVTIPAARPATTNGSLGIPFPGQPGGSR